MSSSQITETWKNIIFLPVRSHDRPIFSPCCSSPAFRKAKLDDFPMNKRITQQTSAPPFCLMIYFNTSTLCSLVKYDFSIIDLISEICQPSLQHMSCDKSRETHNYLCCGVRVNVQSNSWRFTHTILSP